MLLEACFFQMRSRSLLFRAYLGIMQSLYNYEDLLFWGDAVVHCFKRNLALPELDSGP